MKRSMLLTSLLLIAGCTGAPEGSGRWEFSGSAAGEVDETLGRQIFLALDAAEYAGTDSVHFSVRRTRRDGCGGRRERARRGR